MLILLLSAAMANKKRRAAVIEEDVPSFLRVKRFSPNTAALRRIVTNLGEMPNPDRTLTTLIAFMFLQSLSVEVNDRLLDSSSHEHCVRNSYHCKSHY